MLITSLCSGSCQKVNLLTSGKKELKGSENNRIYCMICIILDFKWSVSY